MNPATLALLIPILAIVGGYAVTIMKMREKQRSISNAQAIENKALHDEINSLKTRIEVLEKLVTDDDYQLKRDIERA